MKSGSTAEQLEGECEGEDEDDSSRATKYGGKAKAIADGGGRRARTRATGDFCKSENKRDDEAPGQGTFHQASASTRGD